MSNAEIKMLKNLQNQIKDLVEIQERIEQIPVVSATEPEIKRLQALYAERKLRVSANENVFWFRYPLYKPDLDYALDGTFLIYNGARIGGVKTEHYKGHPNPGFHDDKHVLYWRPKPAYPV